MTTVLLFGTFDVIHPGHEDLIKQAKQKGDVVVVAVARDRTVQETKGKMPRYNEEERVRQVSQIPGVDKAVLGHYVDKYQIILEVNPDVICLGYDQTTFVAGLEEWIKAHEKHINIIRLQPFHPEKYKSSKYKQQSV